MNLQQYSQQALTTLLGDEHGMDDLSPQFMGQALGLVGESGEIAEKLKKIIRDKHGKLSTEDKEELAKELGDILWYVNSVAHLLGYTLEEVAEKNLTKLASRKNRGQIHGAGDNR